MKITILTDDPGSWFVPYGRELHTDLGENGHTVQYVFKKDDIPKGDVCFVLSCSSILGTEYLKRNKHNIVVHASDLPKGKGFSPLQWQIIEGRNEIPLTLFEVVEDVDAGPYYLKDKIVLTGAELYQEIRSILGEKIIAMCLNYVENIHELEPVAQTGEESVYPRRKGKDDEIDPHLPISAQFNHFRIADNENHPLWFVLNGKKYYLKIFDEKNIV